MGTETPGYGPQRSPRPTGKRLTESRKAFMIYLPQSVHARLKAEATKRAVSMSEVACTAVAQFLAAEVVSAPTKPSASPFVVTPPGKLAEQHGADNSAQDTFEVEE